MQKDEWIGVVLLVAWSQFHLMSFVGLVIVTIYRQCIIAEMLSLVLHWPHTVL